MCVGLEGPKLFMLDAPTLATLATFPLPPRIPGGGNMFNDFAGGGYFYLDESDRAVIPTTTRHSTDRAPRTARASRWSATTTSRPRVAPGDKIVSALPDWSGRFWFVSSAGVVGHRRPRHRRGRDALPLASRSPTRSRSPRTASLRRDRQGALPARRRPERRPRRDVARDLRELGHRQARPGRPGLGHDADAARRDWVAITDNADPMNVVVYRRAGHGRGSCASQPVFEKGASATDNSLIGVGRSFMVENNYGYTGPRRRRTGSTTAPGLERVDVDADGTGCRSVWRSQERAPTVVPKLSAANGIVYTYTKDPQPDGADAWYLTALDFRTGQDAVQAPRRGGAGPQQQLRAGHARARRHGLRRRARRPGRAARRHAAAAPPAAAAPRRHGCCACA